MRAAIEFSAKHNIKPHLTLYKLEELPKMVDLMVRCKWMEYLYVALR
jgi:D-arabinose 1-dehydrogenase-like Zn-dependent alcohol dehydrogenase